MNIAFVHVHCSVFQYLTSDSAINADNLTVKGSPHHMHKHAQRGEEAELQGIRNPALGRCVQSVPCSDNLTVGPANTVPSGWITYIYIAAIFAFNILTITVFLLSSLSAFFHFLTRCILYYFNLPLFLP
jgi:hypothetical protein